MVVISFLVGVSKSGVVTLTFSVSVEAVVNEAVGVDIGLVDVVLLVEVVMEGVVTVVVILGVVKTDVVCSVVDFIVTRGVADEVFGMVIFEVIVGFVVSVDTVDAEEVIAGDVGRIVAGDVTAAELLVMLGCIVVTVKGEVSGVVLMLSYPHGMHFSFS